MSEPDISPLARRLAEENNVDWRGLRGSGGGGKVVERDVLEYLARVMAGEEDLNPTPEPLPDGLQAWPDDEVGGFQRGVQGAGRGSDLDDIQRELSASDRSLGTLQEPDSSSRAGPEPDADEGRDEISEDIFLFGDDDGVGAPSEAPRFAAPDRAPIDRAAHAARDDEDSDLDDDLLIAGDDGVAADDDAGDGDALWSTAAAASAPARLPDLFGDAIDVAQVEEDDLDLFADVPAATADPSGIALDIPSFGDLDMGSGARDRAEARGGASQGAGRGAPAPSDDEIDLDDPFGDDPAVGRGRGDDGAAAGLEPATSSPGDPGRMPDRDASGRDLGEPHRAAPPSTAAWSGADRDLAGPAVEVDLPTTDLDLAEAAVSPPVATTAAAGAWDAPTEVAEPEVDPRAAPSPQQALPLVSYGSLVRRHLDLTSLAGAQLAVSLEFGHEEPVPPTAFLLRAAAKAMAVEGWGAGPLLLATFTDSGVQLADLSQRATGPFPALLEAVAEPAPAAQASGASLVVADMSALEVDEAVLNVGAPVLTLGRILYDNQRGSYRCTLAVSGEVAPERGARLLAKVAELLDAPIRLVL